MSRSEKCSTADHFHDWQAASPWGVVVGVSRCRTCGKLSETADFSPVAAPPSEGGKE